MAEENDPIDTNVDPTDPNVDPTDPNVDPTDPIEPEPPEPTIDLIVEDGSLVDNANSYVTLDEFNAYLFNIGKAVTMTDEQKKASLIRARNYLDNIYNWKGRKKFRGRQNTAFPRVEICDIDGYDISGTIPTAVKYAQCEAAIYGANKELFVKYNSNGSVKRQKVDDAVEIEFFGNSDKRAEFTTTYEALDMMLKGLYIPKTSNRISHKVRW